MRGAGCGVSRMNFRSFVEGVAAFFAVSAKKRSDATVRRCAIWAASPNGYDEYLLKCVAAGLNVPSPRLFDPIYVHSLSVRYGNWKVRAAKAAVGLVSITVLFSVVVTRCFGLFSPVFGVCGGFVLGRMIATVMFTDELDVKRGLREAGAETAA